MAWAYEDILKEGSEEYINRGIWLWRALYNRPPNHRKEAMLGISVEFNVFVSMKDKEGKKKTAIHIQIKWQKLKQNTEG